MGGIWLKRSQLIGRTSEIVGYKSGLGLTHEEIGDMVHSEYHKQWYGDNDDLLRIRSEEFEELISEVLYRLGNIPSPSIAPSSIMLYHKYKKTPKKLKMYTDLSAMFTEFLRKTMSQPNISKILDPTPYAEEAISKYGAVGFKMAVEIMEGFNLQMHKSPWGSFRQVEWIDVAQLKELFESESLQTFYGKFIDQRYIDFLDHNFGSIDNINWRKFEALTCEFFDRQGYYVEIGEGRDDGGIDGRAWLKEEDKSGPPTILIQCKRYRRKIDKMVVKALWADVFDEQAHSGLIVTTSSLSPGAEKTCTARSYPIQQANRDTLKKWINVMRTPFKGAYLAE